MNATKAAVEEGILPGGGVRPAACQSGLASNDMTTTTRERCRDREEGDHLASPADRNQCRLTALSSFLRSSKKQTAPMATTSSGRIRDLLSKGIIDPAKVVRAAQSAASVAGLHHHEAKWSKYWARRRSFPVSP